MKRSHYISRLAIDILLVTVCYFIAKKIFPYSGTGLSLRGFILYVYAAAFWYFAAQVTFLYNEFLSRSLSKEIVTVIKTIIVQGAFMVIALFFASRNPLDAKYFMFAFAALELLVLPLAKYLTRWYYATTFYKDKIQTKLLIAGAGALGMDFYKLVNDNNKLGYKVEGFIDDEIKTDLNSLYLGKIADFEKILVEKHIEEVVVALPNTAADKIKHIVDVSDNNAIRVKVIPDYFKLSQNVAVSTMGNIPIVSIRNIPLDDAELRAFKRIFDIVFSVFAFLFIFSWLFPIIMIAIKLSSKGSIFFIQERWGINNKKIACYKFRSMEMSSKDVNENGIYQQAVKDDKRVTKFGKFLRKTNLDELPQFINVLKGEMSVVGPRPHPTPLNLMSKSVVNNYNLRHLVKPGITGWAQIHGLRGSTQEPSLMQKRVDFDIWYIENWSFWLDCQIILQTVINMIKGEKNAY
ncbi:MAG: undecaprenyl-phosphate glucose phosphotransferase [Chitinophagaceae bacterium]|nr:undecaprenyl-phosphate glucose phosphotransferase [Chitinophagaceae bacterium]MCW5904055.1 undecaprenyl-phosphate glucose phosphotransferase [Chitinophagaceae bacterium]